ncbi:MAG: DUF4936 family protein [Betaproteobacteria bacterium]
MLSYYIYYRVAPGREQLAQQKARNLQSKIAQGAEVQGRLLTKRGAADVWMEVYEHVTDANRFESTLQAAAAEAHFEACLVEGSQRNLECFEAA